MYKLLLLTLFTTFLIAHNPKPYAVLGDVIYDNMSKIEALKEIQSYKLYEDDIDKYIKSATQAKEKGYKLEISTTPSAKREYLNILRELSKTNDYFLRSIYTQYKDSMDNNDYKLFTQIINSGLIDVENNKKEIIDYYYTNDNENEIDSTGVIDMLLEEDAKLKAQKKAQKKNYKTKKQLEEEKIQRIRENDKATQKRLEAELQKDLNLKKEQIRKTQKQELAN